MPLRADGEVETLAPCRLKEQGHRGRVEVEVGTDTVAVEAQELAGVERDEKWAEITAAAPGFAEYQTKTSRVIPVIALKRVA